MNVEESYEDLLDFKVVKKFMNDQLDEYNNFPGVVGMSLVLFKDAIEHGLLFIFRLTFFNASLLNNDKYYNYKIIKNSSRDN